jgi:UDP-N-acetylmuramoylalanine--D-glutamate ligase
MRKKTSQKQNAAHEPALKDRVLFPRKASVVGAARSGIAAARFLSQGGCDVLVSDTCEAGKLDFLLASNGLAHLRHEAGEHSSAVLDADVIILSPGVPSGIPVLREARGRNIPVWSEIELAFRFSSAPYAAVTGSSGKSTTVSILGSICGAAGLEHVVAGNIGLPLCAAAPSVGESGVVVAEISSFQLETIVQFHPKVAAILNLSKNHLDRYDSEDDYYDAKKTIAINMNMGDTLVLNARDERLLAWSLSVQDRTRIMFFGAETGAVDCVWHDNSAIFIRRGGSVEKILDVEDMILKGPHNRDNASAAAAMASALGISVKDMARGIAGFNGLAHRLEFVRESDGVKYYNDSKATTAESVACAINSFGRCVHLICGGRDKGCDFAGIRDSVAAHVKGAYCIGEAAERIIKDWNGATELIHEKSLPDALCAARDAAVKGDVVLLSPGCSSFDMFSSYEERGSVFRELVLKLDSKGGASRE